MGMTTKVWAVSDREIADCATTPSLVDTLFHTVADDRHALIHGWRGGGLPRCARQIAGASDATFAISAGDVAMAVAMRERGEPCSLDDVFAIATEAANHVEIFDVARMAAAAKAGLMFCTFEDW
jgi:hypothetical protein